jgi:hypothetical protein
VEKTTKEHKMAALKSGFVLDADEKLVMEIESELWLTSTNLIARLLAGFFRIVATILGTKLKAFLIITDKRVIEIRNQVICWCITAGNQVQYVLPSSVKEIGYSRAGICCKVYKLYYQSHTQLSSFVLKDVDENGAAKAASVFYNTIVKANPSE